jgi:hypothetical protein
MTDTKVDDIPVDTQLELEPEPVVQAVPASSTSAHDEHAITLPVITSRHATGKPEENKLPIYHMINQSSKTIFKISH